MRTAPSGPADRATATVEVFTAESEAQVCRIVLGLKAHGLEGLLQGR